MVVHVFYFILFPLAKLGREGWPDEDDDDDDYDADDDMMLS